jgi:hypothetical protein
MSNVTTLWRHCQKNSSFQQISLSHKLPSISRRSHNATKFFPYEFNVLKVHTLFHSDVRLMEPLSTETWLQLHSKWRQLQISCLGRTMQRPRDTNLKMENHSIFRWTGHKEADQWLWGTEEGGERDKRPQRKPPLALQTTRSPRRDTDSVLRRAPCSFVRCEYFQAREISNSSSKTNDSRPFAN